MSAQVEFRKIVKKFGDQVAVDSLDLEIQSGEFFTLLGPSGSGKTTSLRMLAGLESSTAGEIRIEGRRVDRLVPEKRDIGMVFQDYALFPHMSVFDNVAFPLRARGVAKGKIPTMVSDALAMTELSTFARRYPAQLSGGQRQRVALSRAFVYRPKILLMDEPLGALDRNLRDQMRGELKSLQRSVGITVLYVTHDQDEALSMSDRVGVMRLGRLEQVAEPSVLYEHPQTTFVGRFLGDSVCLPATRMESATDVIRLSVDGVSEPVSVASESAVCPGAEGMMLVRPERFTVTEDEPAASDRNRVKGIAQETVYLGSSVQLLLKADGGASFRVEVPVSQLRPRAGDTYWISWSPDATRFLPDIQA